MGRLFAVNESINNEAAIQRSTTMLQRLSRFFTRHDVERFDMVLDVVMVFITLSSALFFGYRMDMESDEHQALHWEAIDRMFVFCFGAELVVKVWLHGFWVHFGKSRLSSYFDVIMLAIDLIQEFSSDMFLRATIFRLLRLAKVARILRILQYGLFNDMLEMIHGILGVVPTLFWALLLTVIAVYIMALIFRELLGPKDSLPSSRVSLKTLIQYRVRS